MLKHSSKPWVIPTISVFILLVLVMDAMTPRGTADYIFYFIPVAISVLHHSPRIPILVAIVCTILSLIGFQLSADSEVLGETLPFLNRMFAIVALWSVAYLVRKIIQGKNTADRSTWLREVSFRLSESVSGELSIKEVANRILELFTTATDAKVGAMYLKKEGLAEYEFVSGYSFSPSEDKKTIVVGEGVLGQIALNRKLKVLNHLDPYHIPLKTGLGETKLQHIVAIPLLVDKHTQAIVELAYLEAPDDLYIELFDLLNETAAIALRSAEHKAKLAELLALSQRHAEELQAQQEELRVSNEELDQQSKALKESHLRLEKQQVELEQTNQQLEEQTQELENQKILLTEQKKELERKSEELKRSSNYKSEFLANMSHELRTPLNSTLILAKLLSDNKSGNLTKEQVEYAEIIYNSGNDLLNLINDILDLSKVEAGKMEVNPEVVQIDFLMKGIEKLFMPVAKQKNLDFKIHIDPNSYQEIVTDKTRLEQILKNFLSNAFKFTEKGGVSLHVFRSGKDISFAVADTGVGMSPDEQSVIFEAFRQADGTTNRKFGGTGLGLSISKELAHLLKGEIELTSTKGQGSTFTLKLPATFIENEKAPEKSIKVYKAPDVETEKLKEVRSTFTFKDDRDQIQNFARRMLIIEDEEMFAKILYDIAHEMKFGALVAETGEEGIELAKKYQPNGIILDIRLPDHSGMIVLDQLKMNTKTRHIPVHVISAQDFSRSALEMGAIGYMLKPVRKEQLLVAFQNMSSVLEQEMKHVLVVEDDPVQKKYISELIADKNVKVTAVETSTEALKLLAEKTFDCMIMDLSLPDLSGHELLSKLSSESSVYSFPPVIVYTARDLTAEEEEKLRLYSGSIIIKGAKSPERLLSEVTLFLHKVETELPPERQKMLKDLRSREKNLQDRVILLVDDDVRNIFALTASLEGHGAKIITARNGKEALDKLTHQVDLVLMDIMMPEMDGYEAMRRIRANEDFKHLPILALTAKAMKDDKQKCIEAGANDYLSKPIEMDKLLSLIRVWIQNKRRFS